MTSIESPVLRKESFRRSASIVDGSEEEEDEEEVRDCWCAWRFEGWRRREEEERRDGARSLRSEEGSGRYEEEESGGVSLLLLRERNDKSPPLLDLSFGILVVSWIGEGGKRVVS